MPAGRQAAFPYMYPVPGPVARVRTNFKSTMWHYVLDTYHRFGILLVTQLKGDVPMAEERPSESKKVYTLLRDKGLVSDESCPKCNYAPMMDSFNFCPMCRYVVERA